MRRTVALLVFLLAVAAAPAAAQCKEPVSEGGCCHCLLGVPADASQDNRWSVCESSGCFCIGSGQPCATAFLDVGPDGSLVLQGGMLATVDPAPAIRFASLGRLDTGALEWPNGSATRTMVRRECDGAVLSRRVDLRSAAVIRDATRSLTL